MTGAMQDLEHLASDRHRVEQPSDAGATYDSRGFH